MRKYLLLGFILVGCERPFVERAQPVLEIVEPDLSHVQTSRIISILVRSSHFQALNDIVLNGAPMKPSPSGPNYWEISVGLRRGLNTFYIDVTDLEGETNRDTAYTVYLPHSISEDAPHLPEGRGGHSIVRLVDGNLMISGGARRRGGPAQRGSFILTQNSNAFIDMNAPLQTPRTGHTANVLPDNRILIVGGSRVDDPSNVNDLIETVELIDPLSSNPTFTNLPVQGQPIRRAYHTSTLRESSDELILDLIGGVGDVRYDDDPILGIRQDIRSFRIEPTQLVALNSRASAPMIFEPISGHTVTQTRSNSYILLGNQFWNQFQVNVNMRITYVQPSGLSLVQLPQLITPRTAHSSVRILRGFIATFGGQNQLSNIISSVDILHESSNLFFSLTPSTPMVPRVEHTTISAGLGSVLLVGGFGPDGTAITTSEYLRVSSE